MNGSTVPGCLDNYGNPTFGNDCNSCEWSEVCQKATTMRKEIEKQGAEGQ